MKPRIAASLFVSLAALTACTKDAPKQAVADTATADLKGTCADVYKSPVCTFSKMQGSNVLEVGVVVPLASIENAPAKEAMVWPPKSLASVDLSDASRKQSGLSTFTMFWESEGHPPGPYLTPHLDFHFYTISAAEIAAIDCADLSKPTALPAAYALPDIPLPPDMAKMMGVKTLVGLCVPGMGMHAMPASELASKEVFRGTMVVGYYKGKPIFIEPMVTKAMLMEKKSFDLDVPNVPGMSGPHPTKFHADFDATKQEYRMIFSGFTTGG